MTHHHSGRAFYAGLLEALIRVMGSAKGYLTAHGPRVAHVATHLGKGMGLPPERVAELYFASVLCDTGMVGLAEGAFEEPVPELPPGVRRRVELHPVRSQRHVAGIPHLEGLAPLVRHHHEWWDGTGYPDGLEGEEIPVGARILRLADTVAALGEPRPHRGPRVGREVVDVVKEGIGREFCPEVARLFLELDGGGDIPGFDEGLFRHGVMWAAEHLLPEAVSPLSGDQLLAIVANLIDAKDPYTAGHSRRVAALAVQVAVWLGLGERMAETLWAGGYLHDLGKLRVPVRILAKAGTLTEDEFATVKRHPSDGAAILEAIPALRHLTTGARYHHERWDGGGYPEGLAGERIPLVAQIMAVCDAYDAMTSGRAYRGARDRDAALDDVARASGTQFSPRATEAFLSLPREVFEELAEPARPRGREAARPVAAPARRGRRSATRSG